MQLLHLDSSVLGADSVSRQLSTEIVARLRTLYPGVRVVSHDLAANPVAHLSGAHMAVRHGAVSEDPAFNADLLKGDSYLEELLACDILVLGVPMYNFSIPTSLKAWIDRIAVAGKTFRYTETGPEGLLQNKRAFIASARGSVYPPDSTSGTNDHQESYLTALLRFLGIEDIKIVRAEGIAFGPEAKAAAVTQALESIAAIAA
jgi:FMN-dependent NADH-azoreductase